MAKVTNNANKEIDVSINETTYDQEKASGNKLCAPDESFQRQGCTRKSLCYLVVPLILLIIGLAVCLAVSTGSKDKTVATNNNDSKSNLRTYDDALSKLKSTPREEILLSSGETISYREYNKGQHHNLLVLPGFMTDDSIYSILAVLEGRFNICTRFYRYCNL